VRAADALAIVENDKTRYDVVLCDLAMPEIDGAAFYEKMSELGIEDRFVLMSGGAFTDRGRELVASRVCPCIDKPFLIEELLTLLDEVTQGPPSS
jgi:DNA-binding NtrC family response regulator